MIWLGRWSFGTCVALCLVAAPSPAFARCNCACVDGDMQPICTTSIEITPICPPSVCPLAPLAVTPIQPPTIPPVGASYCYPAQVLNPHIKRYQWQQLCR